MNAALMAELREALTIEITSYVPADHRPHPTQHAFLWLNCLEAMYGGAAGGGKSDAMLMAALQYVDQADYAALLLRKTYADLSLPGALMDRAQHWLAPTDARWSEVDKTWRFPSGATLTFGYLQTANDKYRYQGSEFHFIGFDELTQFDELDYRYLASRLRKTDSSVIPLRLRGASNPGGRGHRWVKERFITPDAKAEGRIFIPARLHDNPSLNQEAYRASLDLLDADTRAQLLDGDWDARQPGAWVYDEHGISAAERLGASLDAQRRAGTLQPPAGGGVRLGIDWGEHTVGLVIYPLEGGGLYVSDEVYSTSAVPSVAAHRMLDVAAAHPHPTTTAAYDAAGVQSMRQFMAVARDRGLCAGVGVRLRYERIAFGKYKDETVAYLRLLFERCAAGEATKVIAISPSCRELLRQLRGLEFKDEDLGTVLKRDDHGPDALIAGVAAVAARHRATIVSLQAAAA